MPKPIGFSTKKFDVSMEAENPINPIYGQSLLNWVKGVVPPELEMGDPDYEDWGWFTYVNWEGRSYLVGASSDDGEYWFLQAHKQRTFVEAVTFREKMKLDDPCLQYLYQLVKSEPEFHDVEFV